MAALTTQTISDAGTVITYALAGATDTAQVGNGLNTFLILKNGSAGSVTYTIAVPGNTFFGQAKQDNAIVVAAGVTKMVPLRKEYADETGRATITTTSPAASVEIAVVRIA